MQSVLGLCSGAAVLLAAGVGMGASASLKPPAMPPVPMPGDLPPVVVSTLPISGSVDVDPALKELRVTFSTDMEPNGYSCSFVLGGLQLTEGLSDFQTGSFESADYDAETRTFTFPIELEPGKTYAYWLNLGEFDDCDGLTQASSVGVAVTTTFTRREEEGFRSQTEKKALPYLVGFSTRGEGD